MNPRKSLLIMISVFLSSVSFSQTAVEYYHQAIQAKSDFNYAEAARMLTKAIKLDTTKSDYYVERGVIYIGLDRYKKAQEDFDLALKIDSSRIEPWIGTSLCLLYTDSLASATAVALQAQSVADSPYKKAQVGSLLGEISMSMGKDSIADVYLSESLLLDTTNNRARKKAAQLALRQNDFDLAETLLLKAFKNDAGDLEILINLSYVYNRLEYYRQSMEYANKAIDLDPSQPIAHSNRAYSHFRLGELDKALEDINISIRNNADNPLALRYKGEILLSMENDESDKACKCFDKALKLEGEGAQLDDLAELVSANCAEK